MSMISNVNETISRLKNHILARVRGYLSLRVMVHHLQRIEERFRNQTMTVQELGEIKHQCDKSEVVIFTPDGDVFGVVKVLPSLRIGFKFPREYKIMRAEVLNDGQELLLEKFHVDMLMKK